MCKILKNSYSGSRVMRMRHFLGSKRSISPNKFFFLKTIIIILIYLLNPFIEQNFKKPVNEPFFFIHAYLRVKNQIDINLLVKYLRLKNSEISLAECHF